MSALIHSLARHGWLALTSTALLLACIVPAARGARSVWTVECQHPIVTGVEIYELRHISIAHACPVALAFFRWEIDGKHRLTLYRCHELGQRHPHPHLRLRDFRGWHLSLTPDFVMSRRGDSFAIAGNGFPIACP